MASVRKSSKVQSVQTNNVVIFVEPPPADATIPPVPQDFVAPTNNVFRGVLPKSAQSSLMGAVVTELKRFTDYTEVFGKTSPPFPTVLQTFDAASQWTAMRKKAAAWDLYCRTQEGNAWQDVRRYADRMQPAFELAVAGDETVGARYPAIVRFFNAPKLSAQKAVITKKANQKKEAAGEMPFVGGAGKRRKRAAADEALAEKLATEKVASQPQAPQTQQTQAQPAQSKPAATTATNGAAAPTVNVGNVGSA